MRRNILFPLLVVLIALFVHSVASAQVYIKYEKKTKKSNLVITYNSGGFYYPYGYIPGYPIYPYPRVYYGYPLYYGYPYWSYYDGLNVGGYLGGRLGAYYPDYPLAVTTADRGDTSPARTVSTVTKFSADSILEDGIRSFKIAYYKGAETSFRNAIAKYPFSAEARLLFGLTLFAEGEYHLADKAIRSGLEKAAGSKIITDGLRSLLSKGELAGRLSPNSKDGHLTAGYIYITVGEYEKAKMHLQSIGQDDSSAKRLSTYLK